MSWDEWFRGVSIVSSLETLLSLAQQLINLIS
jgi:hypothetical protein